MPCRLLSVQCGCYEWTVKKTKNKFNNSSNRMIKCTKELHIGPIIYLIQAYIPNRHMLKMNIFVLSCLVVLCLLIKHRESFTLTYQCHFHVALNVFENEFLLSKIFLVLIMWKIFCNAKSESQ